MKNITLKTPNATAIAPSPPEGYGFAGYFFNAHLGNGGSFYTTTQNTQQNSIEQASEELDNKIDITLFAEYYNPTDDATLVSEYIPSNNTWGKLKPK